MIGSGVDMIIDPKTMRNMSKKLEKGKGVVVLLSRDGIDENTMEGTG
jgi:hypothetical protein